MTFAALPYCRVFAPPPIPPKAKKKNGTYASKAEAAKALKRTFKGFVSKLMTAARFNAKKRGQETTITKEWIVEQLVRQNGCCYYSDMPMTFKPCSDWRASLERLNESLGYTPENVVIICYEFNTGNKTQWSREKIAYLRTFPPVEHSVSVLGKRERED